MEFQRDTLKFLIRLGNDFICCSPPVYIFSFCVLNFNFNPLGLLTQLWNKCFFFCLAKVRL